MAVINEPTQWAHPLGNNADISTLPDDAAATAGIASLQKLFQIINATPLEAGGIAPDREDVNALFKYLGDSIFYAMNGGVPSYNAAYDYIPGRVVLYDNNLYKCIQANTSVAPKAPTDSAYWLRITTTADSPTGEIKIWTSSTIPDGFLLCNGSAVSRTTYANLFDKIGTTYGSGDGSTTFNIPDLRDRYIIGANTNALGAKIAEQLPNIFGSFSYKADPIANYGVGVRHADGAFVGVGENQSLAGLQAISGYSGHLYIRMDAHNLNSVYTDNGHVYPQSIALNFIIKT